MTLLAEAVVPQGGWAAYGGAHTIWNLLNPPVHDHPAYKAIVDASLDFLRSRGVPPMRVTGYEWQHWIANGGTPESWLPPRPRPTPAEAPIRALQPGEVRRVAQVEARPDSNVIYVRAEGDKFSSLIDARYSDEDPTRSQSVWMTNTSLYNLYFDIGYGLQSAPHWCDDELEPYFPLPRSTI